MNNGTKWLVALVVVLVLTNIGLAASVWLKKEEGKEGSSRPPRTDARDYLVKELSLNSAQVHSFDSLRKGHFERMKEHREEMRMLKDGLFAQLRWPRNAQADSLAQRIGRLQAAIELETFEHFAALRELLDKEQAERFDNTIQQVLRTMGPKGGPPPPGDGPPGMRMGPPPGDGVPQEGPPPGAPPRH